jgi:hypothetical protein
VVRRFLSDATFANLVVMAAFGIVIGAMAFYHLGRR